MPLYPNRAPFSFFYFFCVVLRSCNWVPRPCCWKSVNPSEWCRFINCAHAPPGKSLKNRLCNPGEFLNTYLPSSRPISAGASEWLSGFGPEPWTAKNNCPWLFSSFCVSVGPFAVFVFVFFLFLLDHLFIPCSASVGQKGLRRKGRKGGGGRQVYFQLYNRAQNLKVTLKHRPK